MKIKLKTPRLPGASAWRLVFKSVPEQEHNSCKGCAFLRKSDKYCTSPTVDCEGVIFVLRTAKPIEDGR